MGTSPAQSLPSLISASAPIIAGRMIRCPVISLTSKCCTLPHSLLPCLCNRSRYCCSKLLPKARQNCALESGHFFNRCVMNYFREGGNDGSWKFQLSSAGEMLSQKKQEMAYLLAALALVTAIGQPAFASEICENISAGALEYANCTAQAAEISGRMVEPCSYPKISVTKGPISSAPGHLDSKARSLLITPRDKPSFLTFGGKSLNFGHLSSNSEQRNSADVEHCKEAEPPRTVGEEEITNESIIEEAWQVVNEKFLDARHHKWSPDIWLKKKEEVLKRPVPSRMAAYGIIRSMLADLNDPYSRFITPRELKQLSKYDLTGIGLSLGELSDERGGAIVQVVGIVLGSPAQIAGVRQGDELLSVDGVSVNGKTAFEASSLIQGPKGTVVSIEMKHGPCGERQRVLVERQQAVRTPVYYRMEQGPDELIGYIRLKEFNSLAKKDLVTAMNRLKVAGATSFLLDLQDNPGGLVQAGIEIAKLFLGGGETVIYTVGKDSGSQKGILASGPPLTTAPVMVLVNEHTASASEIVAAALHDNCRAALVGHRTFGKGLIQSVFELSDGSGVILTVGKYVTPSLQDIDGNGIEPDFQQLPGLNEAKLKLQKCKVPA